ncbi:hypothetical protein ABW19_dt0204962 [Dactylella cylindrospora]|nr:hypothetical protein ABW19_dt0204962 [Dactylella cylindrospora]
MAHLSALDELARIFKRQAKCVECPNTVPSCKTHVCDEGLTCVLQVQSCDSCAKVECQRLTTKTSNSGSNTANKSGGGAPVGAIVGGVVGALVVICLIAFLVFRRNKKKQKAAYEASVAAWAVEKENKPDGGYRDARASTHSVGSIASTVLTRASNVIQIAYIPGVTNRSNPSSPGYLGVPPVPSIPGQRTSQASGDHYFSADDIARQSVWSTHSGLTVGADPRASVATTIYRSNAIVSPLAATATVVRAKAAVVTVKNSPAPSSGASSPRTDASDTPPVPSIDISRFPAPKSNGLLSPTRSERPPTSPAFSVGSTFLNKMSMTTVPEEKSNRHSTATGRSVEDIHSPFSDRASIDNDTLGPLRTGHTAGRTSPARHMEGDIRMSFRPISEVGSEAGDSPSLGRAKSPFGDENRVDKP